VLLPASAAQHEYVHGNLDDYFSSRSNWWRPSSLR